MATVQLVDLFEKSRFPKGLALVPILLYFPLGIVLCVLRVFIGFNVLVVASILAKKSLLRRFVLRVMCGVLGIVLTTEGMEQRDSSVKLLLSNHSSVFDHLATDLIVENFMLLTKKVDKMIQWLMGFVDLGYTLRDAPVEVNIQEYCRDSPYSLLVFPEGVTTSGKKALLRFQEWPFRLGLSIQPIAIQTSRPPFTNVAISVLGSTYVSDIFWHLFVPYTHFHLKILPVIRRNETETTEDYCRRAEKLFAEALKLEVSNFTSADKAELFKRMTFQPPVTNQHAQSGATPNLGSDSSLSTSPTLITRGSLRSSWRSSSPEEDQRLNLMTQQVKEVLTQVPLHVIKRDLSTTRDVDMTITNLLEGTVAYTPEDSAPQKPKPNPMALSPVKIAAKSFSKSSQERHQSFEERKKILIDTAREKYMMKHGMLGTS
ncbi:lipid droplet-regulating VLDL assembly factor AUP1-like [Lineus longissimus]|uniref:lipid droplet-regulating VLDL assembly factor AUP1-like n=1 Tax=Lineus longissimus TaxID=88925 RepID=UPI002B4CAFF0